MKLIMKIILITTLLLGLVSPASAAYNFKFPEIAYTGGTFERPAPVEYAPSIPVATTTVEVVEVTATTPDVTDEQKKLAELQALIDELRALIQLLKSRM